MFEENQIDEMGSADNPVAVDTPPEEVALDPAPDDGEIISEPEVEITDEEISEEALDETPEEEDLEALSTSQPDDSVLIKKLRGILKTKIDTPTISESQQEALSLVDELYAFDPTQGVPTTKGFAEKLASKDINLAQQTYRDLAQVPLNDQGWTIGHEFLKTIGLDPYKIEELRQFSRGEITGEQYGVVQIPPEIPGEYIEAYKSLSQINRDDVDIYINSQNEQQKHAALELLRDRQDKLDNVRVAEQRNQAQTQTFQNEVTSEVEGRINTTYTNLMSTIKSNPAYTGIKVSSSPKIDSLVKDSIISQINAIGDPNQVLAQQAIKSFEEQGVKIDVAKVSELMKTIETNTEIVVKAEKLGKIQGRDYSVHIQEANRRISEANGKALALANKYFSQTLAAVTGKVPPTPDLKETIPITDKSGNPPPRARPRGVMSEAELDKSIVEVARRIQKGAS